MADLETIIRPFQTGLTTPPQRVIGAAQKYVPNLLLRFGRSGSGKIMQGSYSHHTVWYADKQEKEKTE